jgi:hypothetical protein
MRNNVPPWALRVAIPEDHSLVQAAQSQDRMQVEWPDLKRLQSWAGHQGWEVPWFGFQQSFIRQMLDNEENFKLAVNESGIRVFVPKQEHSSLPNSLENSMRSMRNGRQADGLPAGALWWRNLERYVALWRRALRYRLKGNGCFGLGRLFMVGHTDATTPSKMATIVGSVMTVNLAGSF